jgi:hypothetical protein
MRRPPGDTRRPLPLSLILSSLSHAHALSPFLCFSSPRACPSLPPWPPPRLAASRLLASRRACLEVRHSSLFIPSTGINEGRPSSPPESPIPSPDPSSADAKFAAVCPSPARLTSPECPWWATGPTGPLRSPLPTP